MPDAELIPTAFLYGLVLVKHTWPEDDGQRSAVTPGGSLSLSGQAEMMYPTR